MQSFEIFLRTDNEQKANKYFGLNSWVEMVHFQILGYFFQKLCCYFFSENDLTLIKLSLINLRVDPKKSHLHIFRQRQADKQITISQKEWSLWSWNCFLCFGITYIMIITCKFILLSMSVPHANCENNCFSVFGNCHN